MMNIKDNPIEDALNYTLLRRIDENPDWLM